MQRKALNFDGERSYDAFRSLEVQVAVHLTVLAALVYTIFEAWIELTAFEIDDVFGMGLLLGVLALILENCCRMVGLEFDVSIQNYPNDWRRATQLQLVRLERRVQRYGVTQSVLLEFRS